MSAKYREMSTLRAWLKKQALLKGKQRRAGKSDPRIAPYMYFFYCLSDQEESISQIFKLVAKAEKGKLKAASDLDSKDTSSADFGDIQIEQMLEHSVIQNEEAQDIFAGTLFVILNSLLRSLTTRVAKRGGLPAPVKAGRKIGRTTMFELIGAASNNFRHYEEWHGATQKNKNIAILKAAGLRRPWDRNVCSDVLKLTGWKSRKQLSSEIRQLASELFRHQTNIPL